MCKSLRKKYIFAQPIRSRVTSEEKAGEIRRIEQVSSN